MSTPGYFSGSPAVGVSPSLRGKVAGRRPLGSASPKSTLASAGPARDPGYHASSSPASLPRHGVSTGPPVSSTTMVFPFAAATFAMSASWSPCASGHSSVRQLRSAPSVS